MVGFHRLPPFAYLHFFFDVTALVIRAFLDSTSSQLTYHGLFHLASKLPSGELVALFRNSHLSVLYKDGEDLVLDGNAFEYEDEDELDYVDPEPEQAIEKTPMVASRELHVEPPHTDDADASAASQQRSILNPQLDHLKPDAYAAPVSFISTSPSSSTSILISQPPLPGASSTSHSLLSNAAENSQLHGIPSSTPSQPNLKGPETHTSQPQLPQSPSHPQLQPQPQLESQSQLPPDSELNSSSAVQPVEHAVSSTSSSDFGSTDDPSSSVPQIVAVSLPEDVPATTIAPPSAASASASEPEPAVALELAPVPESLPDPSHYPPPSSPPKLPPRPLEQPPVSSDHPQNHPNDRPSSPLSQLQRLGRSPTQIQQAPSQSTTTSSRTSVTHASRTTYTSGAGSRAGSALYTLVTDQVFLHEPSVVWERIEDVDGADGMFVDGGFVRSVLVYDLVFSLRRLLTLHFVSYRSSPAGGDFAGHTAEETARAIQEAEREAAAAVAAAMSGVDPVSEYASLSPPANLISHNTRQSRTCTPTPS